MTGPIVLGKLSGKLCGEDRHLASGASIGSPLAINDLKAAIKISAGGMYA